MGRWHKKIWEWVSHGDTVWGIMNMIFSSLGGLGGGFFTWATSNPAIIFFAILSGIALGLFISNEISAKRIQKRGIITTPQSTETLKLADQMNWHLRRDTNNFPRCIFVHNMTINWHPLRETDSSFLIHYDVYSSSVFKLDIGKKVDGHLCYGSEPMEKTIEVLSPIEQLERSTTQHLVLRQWVSESRMNRVALDGGEEIDLVFSDINIWVEAKFPNGSEGPRCRLPIPDKLKVRIPTQVELES